MQQAEPLIHWPQPFIEYLGFVAVFVRAGAIGFRYSVLRGRLGARARVSSGDRAVYGWAAQRAAALGLVAALVVAFLFATDLSGSAREQQTTVLALVTGSTPQLTGAVLALIAVLGFALVLAGLSAGWPLAALGVLASPLRGAFFGHWDRIVNPVHELAGGLWIGSLFMLVAAGLAASRRGSVPAERRGTLAAEMVNRFSPLALTSAGLLGVFGATTAWLHLKPLRALWTTPYGYALIVKLCVVLGVLGLGAWNWRRQRPRMGSERATAMLRRSAMAELAVAAIVLAVTAVLVSLPAPGE
jgi:copper transport protein